MAVIVPPADWRLVAADTVARTFDASVSVPVDHVPWGAVAARAADGLWRAEHSRHGVLLVHAAQSRHELALACWAPPAATWTADEALDRARGWVGLHDGTPDALRDLVAEHPVLRELDRTLGPLPLSRLPGAQEAVGRALIGQLVQFREAERSTAQLARMAGTPAGGLYAWPEAARLRDLPDWSLRRRCGVSARIARALRLAAAEDVPLSAAARRSDWDHVDRRLRAIPGVGQWSSGTARLSLGDADAVPFGDYGLPGLAGHALTGGEPPSGGWTDAHLDELLAPFRPHRGRVVRLLMLGAVHGRALRPPRRAPRAALSAHRYW